MGAEVPIAEPTNDARRPGRPPVPAWIQSLRSGQPGADTSEAAPVSGGHNRVMVSAGSRASPVRLSYGRAAVRTVSRFGSMLVK